MSKTKPELESEPVTELPSADPGTPATVSAAAESPIPGTVETTTEVAAAPETMETTTEVAAAPETMDCIVIRGHLTHDGKTYPPGARVALPLAVALGLIASQTVVRADAPA